MEDNNDKLNESLKKIRKVFSKMDEKWIEKMMMILFSVALMAFVDIVFEDWKEDYDEFDDEESPEKKEEDET